MREKGGREEKCVRGKREERREERREEDGGESETTRNRKAQELSKRSRVWPGQTKQLRDVKISKQNKSTTTDQPPSLVVVGRFLNFHRLLTAHSHPTWLDLVHRLPKHDAGTTIQFHPRLRNHRSNVSQVSLRSICWSRLILNIASLPWT